MDLDTAITSIFLLLPFFFALICLYYAMAYLKSARGATDIPTSKIRSAAQGYVSLNGTAKPLFKHTNIGTIDSLTQKPCAWYDSMIEWFGPIANNINSSNQAPVSQWNILERSISTHPFILRDDTGDCIVLPINAEVISRSVVIWRGHTRVPSPPTHSFLRWLFWENWGPYRYTEHRLEFDAPIYASGSFHTWSIDNPFIQANPFLKAYAEENAMVSVNILSREDLDKNEDFLLSAIPQGRVVRQWTLKALMFFIGFVFFTFLMVHNTYPIVKKTLANWSLEHPAPPTKLP